MYSMIALFPDLLLVYDDVINPEQSATVYLKSIERLESLFNGKNISYITLLNFIVREDSKTN